LLDGIDAKLIVDEKEDVEAELKKIQSSAYRLGKEI